MIQSQIIPLRYNYGGISRCFEICEGQLFLCFIDEITKGDYTESKSHKVMISTNPRYINWLLTNDIVYPVTENTGVQETFLDSLLSKNIWFVDTTYSDTDKYLREIVKAISYLNK